MKPLFAVLLLAVTPAMAQNRSTLPPHPTLTQALEIALTNSTTLREAQPNLQRTSGQYEQSRSALLPQVGVVARQGYLTLNLQGFGIDLANTPRLIGPFGSMDARFILTQDLFNIANVRSWQSYSSHRDSSRYLVENAREVVALNVVGAYLQALLAKASRDTLVEQL